MEHIVDASEQLTRAAIARIPDGSFTFEDYCDNDAISDDPIRIAVRVTVKAL
jgi:N-methylhydantoinase B/oxoprolinase/acetone carboxylase alpha subunit